MAVDPSEMNIEDWKVRYQLFEKSALNDQRNFYNFVREKNQAAARQVNQTRAGLAFGAGVSAAMAGTIAQIYFANGACGTEMVNKPITCNPLQGIIVVLTVLSVALPALAALFNTLADLYQWDRTTEIYEIASQTIEYADALSPVEQEDDVAYRTALIKCAEATLAVMQDEQTQWGRSMRTPSQLDEFVKEQVRKTESSAKR